MKKSISLVIIFLSLFACSSQKNMIPFGVDACIKLGKNESQQQITKIQLDFFKKYLAIDSFNLQLNKVISAGTRSIYISMSTTNSCAQAQKSMQQFDTRLIYDQKKFSEAGKTFASFFFKKENYFINRVLFNEAKDSNLIMFDYVGSDSSTVAIFYKNHNLLTDKINCSDDK